MGRGRPRKNAGKDTIHQLKTIDRKPIRPLERQRMRPWLSDQLDQNKCHQLVWMNKRDSIFRIAWKHAAGQTFEPEADATLFEQWARHTGKYYDGDRPDPKKWKANFRCALNSLLDVDEDKSQGVRKGGNAFKVYRFLSEKKEKKKPAAKKEKALEKELDVMDEDSNSSYSDSECDVMRTMAGTRSRPRRNIKDELDSEGSENGSSPSYDSNQSESDWDLTNEETRHPEHYKEPQKSPLPNFDQLCQSCPSTSKWSRPFHSASRPRHSPSPVPVQDTYTPPSTNTYVTPNTDSYPTPSTETLPQEHAMSEFEGVNCPSEEEIVEAMPMTDDLWSIMDITAIQEAPEEVVYSGVEEGPNVIVLCEPQELKIYEYELTGLSDL